MMKKQLKNKYLLIFVSIILLISCSIIYLIRFNNKTRISPNEIKRAMSYNEITNGDIENCEYVKFSSFFTRDIDGDGYAEKYDGTCNHIKDKVILYFDINVLTEGKLEDGKISINGKNFNLSTSLIKDNILKDNYIGSNISNIEFDTLNAGTQKLFSGFITANIGNNINNYSAEDNKVIFEGKWVSSDGSRTIPIRKEINLKADWYGYTETEYKKVNTQHNIGEIINNNKFIFNVGFEETKLELLIQKQVTEVNIPNFKGYNPKKVVVNSDNCEYEYDNTTQKLIITRKVESDTNGDITKSVPRTNNYEIQVEYPQEAFSSVTANSVVSLTFETVGYYYGYNNSSDEFSNENPYVSNATKTFTHTWRKIESNTDYNAKFSITVGEASKNSDTNEDYQFVSKDKTIKKYNNIESDEAKDTYIVEWKAFTGNTFENQNGISMQESKEDYFSTNSGELISMKDYSKPIGVYFENCFNSIGSNGWIKLYDNQTNELLETFTIKNWNDYNQANPYKLDSKVKSIKVETSKADENKYFYVYQVKEINDEKIVNDISFENFEKIDLIKSYLKAGLISSTGNNSSVTKEDKAYYEAPISAVDLSVSQTTINNQQTNSMQIDVIARSYYFNEANWKNGEFVVEMPEEILQIEIDEITCDNSNVKVSSYETFENNGKQYIKIYTNNEIDQSRIAISIKADITADSRVSTTEKSINLYAINENCHNYRATSRTKDILDINENGNQDEYVALKSKKIKILAPSSLLTSQTLSEFDDSGKSVVSPQIAILDKSNEARDAKISVSITNNYSGTISENIIIGKIPFKGNKNQLNDKNLGSTYSVTMKENGIIVPEKVKTYAKIYYSNKEKVTEDLNDTNNNWVTKDRVSNWQEIKSYLIDLGEYKIPVNEQLVFDYGIVIPGSINYNDITYSTHAVYFCLDTKEGKLEAKTEANKLGIMIAKKYNVELKKYKNGTNKLVSGAIYKITEGENSKTNTTTDGLAIFKGLYADKEYTLKEIKSPDSYVLNEDEVKFKVTVDDRGEPQINVISGNLRGRPSFTNTENGFVLNLDVDDIAKYDLKLLKKDSNSGSNIDGVKFKFLGGVYGDTGREFTTVNNGQISITNLLLDTEYTLQETEADGYYINKTPIKFKLSRNESGEIIVISESAVLSNSRVVENETADKALFNINLENTPIPTYSLNIKKKNEKGEDLKGTQFKLTSLDTNKEEYATTDDNGNIKFESLYQFVEGKNITGEYKLQETMATEGYITDNTEVKFKVESDTTGLKISILEGEEAVESSSSDSNSITFNIVNKPIFKLTKKGDKDKLLPGAKFKITGEAEQLGEAKEITMTNVGTHPETGPYWTQKEDGTWVGHYSSMILNGDAILESEEFEVTEDAKLTFEWTVSTSNNNSFYYTITNLDSNASIYGLATVIGGINETKICGTSYGTEYSDLKFNPVSIDLSKGKYRIEFTFVLGSNPPGAYYGLNKAFVKNVKLSGEKTKTKIIDKECITNEKGEITDNLPAGVYKLEEIEAPDGYQLPENKEDRIYNVSIGESKPEERALGKKSVKSIGGSGLSNINSIKATSDGGYIIAGSYSGEIELKMNNSTIKKLNSNGELDALVVKFDENDNIEWYYSYGNTGSDEIKDVDASSDGYIAVGYKTTDKKEDGLILKINKSGEKVFERLIEGNQTDIINSVKVLSTEDFVVVGKFNSNKIILSEGVEILNYGNYDGFVACYKPDGTYYWSDGINNSSNDVEVVGVIENSDRVIIATNCKRSVAVNGGTIYTYYPDSSYRSMYRQLICYDLEGQYKGYNSINDSKRNWAPISKIESDAEGNIILSFNNNYYYEIGKYRYDSQEGKLIDAIKTFYINNISKDKILLTDLKTTSDGGMVVGGEFQGYFDANGDKLSEYKSNGTDGIIIKLDADGKTQWARNLSGSKDEKVTGVAQLKNGDYIEVGNFDSPAIFSESTTEIASLSGTQDSFIIRYGETITSPAIPEAQEITVTNELKKYDITTEIIENSDRERVGGTITGDNTETPNKKLVEKVKNGYDSTKEIVIEPATGYTVYSVKINNRDYKFVPDERGIVKIPVFKEVTENKHITVSFEKNISSVLVHHYLKDKDGNYTEKTLADDEYYSSRIGERYSTEPKGDIEGYELEKDDDGKYKIPSNALGTFKAEQTVVRYYYEETPYTLTVHHYLEGTETSLEDDEIYKKYKDEPYETSPSENLLKKYDVLEELTNVVPNGETSGSIKEDTEVTYFYSLKEYNYKIEYYYEGVIDEQKTVKGTAHYDELIDNYEPKLLEGYKLSKVENCPLKITENEDKNVIKVYYILNTSRVLVHHYFENTTQQFADDVEITGKINDKYETTPIENIPVNYTCVNETPTSYKGKITNQTIEVIYYYALKTPKVDTDITKTATANAEKEYKVSSDDTKVYPVLTKEDEAVTYEITYNVKIEDYIGKADIEITDTLPALIDEEKSKLADGVYDAETKTIKWNIELKDINTYEENKAYETEIKKTIKIVFKGQDVTKDLVNDISGNIKLYYPEDYPNDDDKPQVEEKDEDKVTVKQEYKAKLEIEKQWKDDKEEKRPESVTINVKSEPGNFDKDYVLKAIDGWKIEIKDLPKYTENGEKITYKITEKISEDIKDYDYKVLSEETQTVEETIYKYIITNTYNPKIDIGAKITKEGSNEIKSSKDAIKYKIHFTSKAKGTAILKIIDTLPYKIDTKKSELAEGIYDEEKMTITWEYEISNENANEIYDVDITKDISIVFENVDLTKEKLTNTVFGEIQMKQTGEKESITDRFDTQINVKGKVIVKYLDENGKQVSEDKEITGKVGDNYKTEPQEVEGYELTKVPENAEGKITEETIIVTYSYKKKETVQKQEEPKKETVPKQEEPKKETVPKQEEPKKETPVETVKIIPEDTTPAIAPSTQHKPAVYTGDNEHIGIYIAIIIISVMYLISMLIVVIVKKLKNK